MSNNQNINLIKYSFIKCDYCSSIRKVKGYSQHLLTKHKIELPKNFDFKKKIELDKIFVFESQQKAKENQIRVQKEKRKKQELDELQSEIVRQKFIEENKIEIPIIWGHIFFGAGKIRFQHPKYKELNYVFCNGVIESLNILKKDYFDRLFGKIFYKLSFVNNELIFDNKHSPGWVKMLNAIEFALEYNDFYNIKIIKPKIISDPKISNAEIIKLFKINHNEFLQKLASMQCEKYKIIPIIEFINNHQEECFIFRLTSKHKGIITFWENVNSDRACHVFSGDDTDGIQNFILRDDLKTKRSLLYSNSKDYSKIRSHLNYITSIRHSNIHSFNGQVYKLLMLK